MADADDALAIGGRLEGGPSAELVASAFAAELDAQRGLARAMGLADLAHTIALVEAGVIPAAPGKELLRALLALHDHPEELVLDPAAGDLYTNREAWLAARTPAVGWLGAGRARREATTVAFHLTLRRRWLDLHAALAGHGRALVGRGVELAAALCPDYTYLQAAQATSFGHTLLAYAPPAVRDLARLRAAFDRADRSPAGCGSANGSRLPQNRAHMAELLGFRGLVGHARDAMWQADLPVESLAVVVAAGLNLDRLAEDLLFYTSAEVGFVELGDGHARASKVMPHKKNPYALAYVRAAANRAIGVQAAVAAAGRTPSGQVDNRLFAYGDVPRAIAEMAGAASLLGAVVAGLRFKPERAAACLAGSFVAATDLAEVLVQETGLDWRTAHRVVGVLARELAEKGRAPASLRPADLTAAAARAGVAPVKLDADTLARALDPADAVRHRSGVGGAGAAPMAALAEEQAADLDDAEAWRSLTTERVDRAEDALVARARSAA